MKTQTRYKQRRYFSYGQLAGKYFKKTCNETERIVFANSGTKYTACPKCKFVAFGIKSTRTIRAATYSSVGEGMTEKLCEYCGHKAKERYTIAKKERSSSSSSSGSSSSWSSSSSGGSWGGGSSSGGGASSSW